MADILARPASDDIAPLNDSNPLRKNEMILEKAPLINNLFCQKNSDQNDVERSRRHDYQQIVDGVRPVDILQEC